MRQESQGFGGQPYMRALLAQDASSLLSDMADNECIGLLAGRTSHPVRIG